MRAAYEIVSRDDVTLTIRDTHGQVTVTNDAESVVAALHRFGQLGSRRLFYYDSYGDLDELRHDGQGHFLGFAPGPR